jgi:hypothetical protein
MSFEETMRVLDRCCIVVGMHPDQAAGAIVDFALAKNIPFALVPCCPFSKEFPKRKLKNGEAVKSYEQLIQFLKEKDDGIQSIELPFEGRNICVYKLKSTKI